LALAAPAFGETARKLFTQASEKFPGHEVKIHLTKMADNDSSIVTNDDLFERLTQVLADPETRVIIFNAAVCDFYGHVVKDQALTPSGKYEKRLVSRDVEPTDIRLFPHDKLVTVVKQSRPEVFLVTFKTTCGASELEMASAAEAAKNNCGANAVWCNDTKTRRNMLYVEAEPFFGSRESCAEKLFSELNEFLQSKAASKLHGL